VTHVASGSDLPRASPAVSQARSRQLDVFRGIAAILMIFNHSGVKLLGAAAASGDWASALVFLGSAAPALFFFATGVGSGFGSGRGEAAGAMLRKVALLLMADALLNWSFGKLVGIDFFGFAAIATLALFLVRRSSHPAWLAALLTVLVLGVRFGAAPFARGQVLDDTFLAFVTGIAQVRDVSYPLGPWLTFPLLGFLAGRRWRAGAARDETWVVGAAAVVCAGAATLLALDGAPVFRWGSVSIAFYLCAVAIVAAAWLGSRWLNGAAQALASAVHLRGPASLLIVPLHYGILGALAELISPPLGDVAWLVGTALIAAGVLALSRGLVAGASRLAVPGAVVQASLVAATCALSLLAYFQAAPLLRLEVGSAGEVVTALLLLWSSTRKSAGQQVGPGSSTVARA
jgi:uncharacterized membrane protein